MGWVRGYEGEGYEGQPSLTKCSALSLFLLLPASLSPASPSPPLPSSCVLKGTDLLGNQPIKMVTRKGDLHKIKVCAIF